MSTLLVTLTVVFVAIAIAVAVAVRDPDQPATIRPRPWRERRRRRQRVAKPAVAAVPRPAVRQEPVERAAGGLSDHWMPSPAGVSPWVRLRSGVVLTVLLAVMGALLAASISGLLLLIALAVRDAVS